MLFLLIKGTIVDHVTLSFLDVDLVTIIIAYLLVFYGETGAGIFAFTQGVLIDVFSGGPLGLFTFLYLSVLLGIILISRFFDLQSISGQVIIIILVVLLKEVLFVTFLDLFALEMRLSSSVFIAFSASAVCSGLFGPFLFYLLNQFNRLLVGVMRSASDEWI